MGRKKIAIIGGGPAGYVSAIRASHLGAEVTLVEKDLVGGTCVNRGCIPTKSLISSVNIYNAVRNSHEFGISVSKVRADFPQMMRRKERMIHETREGILKWPSGLRPVQISYRIMPMAYKSVDLVTLAAENFCSGDM